MNLEINNPRIRRLVAAIILLIGLGSAVVVYLTAANAPDNGLGYQVENGTIYPMSPGDTKIYRRNMELYGGRANVIVDDIRQWFAGLWHGRHLAYTLTVITVLVVQGFLFVTNPVPLENEHDDRGAK
jgi:hypothetical protein